MDPHQRHFGDTQPYYGLERVPHEPLLFFDGAVARSSALSDGESRLASEHADVPVHGVLLLQPVRSGSTRPINGPGAATS